MERVELLEKLQLARPCLSTQDIVPILSHFCFTEDDVTAFNGTQAIIVDHETDLECGIPGELLIKLLNSYSAGKISVDQKGNDLDIKAGKSKAKLASLAEDAFLFEMPDLDGAHEFSVTADFLTGLTKTLLSVSKNSLQRSQFGVTLDSTKKGAHLYSTDNSRVSRYTLEKSLGKKPIKVLLPEVFCQLLIDLSKSTGDSEPDLYIGDDFIYAAFEGVYLYSKLLIDVEFLDFEAVIGGNWDGDEDELQGIPDELTTAIERTALLTSKETDQIVHLDVEDSTLKISGNSGYGEVKEDLTLEDIEDISCRMDANLLLAALQSVDEMTLCTSAGEMGGPMFIGTSGNFFHLLMGFRED
jgi:DNA polymerase III sliding clamp (beta) subunit (PCNA family)